MSHAPTLQGNIKLALYEVDIVFNFLLDIEK